MRREPGIIGGVAAASAIVSIAFGAWRARDVARSTGEAFSKSEMSRWIALGVATAFAVALIGALDAFAQRRRNRAIEAFLVVFAPLALFAVSVAAYLPERDLIAQGWYVNVGELALWWGWICGGPFVVIGHLLLRRSVWRDDASPARRAG